MLGVGVAVLTYFMVHRWQSKPVKKEKGSFD